VLAYQGPRPLHHFLFLCPAPAGGHFAFSFRHDGRKFGDARLLMPLNDQGEGFGADSLLPYEGWEPRGGVFGGNPTGFHDFFHALRVWDLATAGELKR
jgi:hypothetical protein